MESRIFVRKKKFKPNFSGPKALSKRINLNLILSKITSSSFPDSPNDLYSENTFRVFFYRLIKILKNSKYNKKSSSLVCFGWKYQLSGLYVSFVEMEKRKKRTGLVERMIKVKSSNALQSFFQKPSVAIGPLKKRRNMENISKGLVKFSNLYSNLNESGSMRQVFFDTLKTRRFFPNIFFSRLFLYAAAGKKRYSTGFFYAFKRKRKIDSLFHLYTLSSLKFRDMKRQRRQFFKKVVWRISREKKWKRRVRVSFALFRLRQKLSQVFYVPKHFEINYKTLTTGYLGYTDSKTTNTKVPFWLNLRKLLTFLT
jgi:hypothetical protein